MDSIFLREANLKDLGDLIRLYQQLAIYEKRFDPNLELTENEKTIYRNFYNYIRSQDAFIIVAIKDGMMIGYLCGYLAQFKNTRPKKGVLDTVYIEENYRHQQLGKRLIKEFFIWCKKRQIRFITVSVYSKNIFARHLYEKCNFVPWVTQLEADIDLKTE